MTDIANVDAACVLQAEAVRAAPLSVIERKRMATLEFMRGAHAEALGQLAVALTLPVDDAEIVTVATDLAILIPVLIGTGQAARLDEQTFRAALVAKPLVVKAVQEQFFVTLSSGNPLQLSAEDVAKTIAYLSGIGQELRQAAS